MEGGALGWWKKRGTVWRRSGFVKKRGGEIDECCGGGVEGVRGAKLVSGAVGGWRTEWRISARLVGGSGPLLGNFPCVTHCSANYCDRLYSFSSGQIALHLSETHFSCLYLYLFTVRFHFVRPSKYCLFIVSAIIQKVYIANTRGANFRNYPQNTEFTLAADTIFSW